MYGIARVYSPCLHNCTGVLDLLMCKALLASILSPHVTVSILSPHITVSAVAPLVSAVSASEMLARVGTSDGCMLVFLALDVVGYVMSPTLLLFSLLNDEKEVMHLHKLYSHFFFILILYALARRSSISYLHMHCIKACYCIFILACSGLLSAAVFSITRLTTSLLLCPLTAWEG